MRNRMVGRGRVGSFLAYPAKVTSRWARLSVLSLLAAILAPLMGMHAAGAAVVFSQNFDGVAAPALPAGWTSTAAGIGTPFVTTTASPDTAPNAAFTAESTRLSDIGLVSPVFTWPQNGMLTFRHKFDTEIQHDAGALEIKIYGTDWRDFTTTPQVGGTYVAGGYTGYVADTTGPSGSGSPLRNRYAWTGNSGGYITTIAYLPAAAAGQSVQLRWRFGTDDGGLGGNGWSVDSISVTNDPAKVTLNQAVGQADPATSGPVNFTATFSRPVTGFSGSDISFAGSTAPGTLAAAVTGGPSVYNVAVSGITGYGTIKAAIPAGAVDGGNQAATSTDATVLYQPATVTINQASGQADPTTSSPINFTATFSKAVTGFTASDVSFNGSNAPGTLAAAITGGPATYNVAVSGMAGPGVVKVGIPVNSVDGGNAPSTTTDDHVNFSAASVTINQASGQADPALSGPINFTATFNRAVTGFTAADVSLAGSTAQGTLTATVTGSGAAYNVAISGMTGPGTVKASIPTNVVDGGNVASTSTDNTVTFGAVGVVVSTDSAQKDPTGFGQIFYIVRFTSPVSGFTESDLSFAGSTAPGPLVATSHGSDYNQNQQFHITVTGMSGPGVVKLSVPANVVDGGNAASTSTDNTVTFSGITVTLNQAASQADPTSASTVNFTAVFSNPVTGFTGSDVTLDGSTAPGTLKATVTGGPSTYNVAVSGMTGPGKVSPWIYWDVVDQGNAGATSTDGSVDFSGTAVTVNQASGQADPTAASPINFTATFSKAVTGFTAADVSFAGSTAPGTLTAAVTGGPTTYTVAVSGMTGSGLVKASVPANAVNGGNAASTSTDNSVSFVNATVTINQAAGQADPTAASPINFTVVFSKAVTGFTASDVALSGDAPGTLTKTVTGGPSTYNVAVAGMTGPGLIRAIVAANVVDGGNAKATFTDNAVTFVNATVTVEQRSGQADPTSGFPINFTVRFSKAVTGFTAADVSFAGSTYSTALTATVTGSGATYNVAVSGGAGSGVVKVSVPGNVVDGGNAPSKSVDNQVTVTH